MAPFYPWEKQGAERGVDWFRSHRRRSKQPGPLPPGRPPSRPSLRDPDAILSWEHESAPSKANSVLLQTSHARWHSPLGRGTPLGYLGVSTLPEGQLQARMNGLLLASSAPPAKLGRTAQVSLSPDLLGLTQVQEFLVPEALRAGVLLPACLCPSSLQGVGRDAVDGGIKIKGRFHARLGKRQPQPRTCKHPEWRVLAVPEHLLCVRHRGCPLAS